jgi:hypothetical protein
MASKGVLSFTSSAFGRLKQATISSRLDSLFDSGRQLARKEFLHFKRQRHRLVKSAIPAASLIHYGTDDIHAVVAKFESSHLKPEVERQQEVSGLVTKERFSKGWEINQLRPIRRNQPGHSNFPLCPLIP